jgi:hypothetical protein
MTNKIIKNFLGACLTENWIINTIPVNKLTSLPLLDD